MNEKGESLAGQAHRPVGSPHVGAAATESGRRIGDLISKIRESADKLERDGSSRGDLKLLSRALRELRYAFKVFSPYRQRPQGHHVRVGARRATRLRISRRSILAGLWQSNSGWW